MRDFARACKFVIESMVGLAFAGLILITAPIWLGLSAGWFVYDVAIRKGVNKNLARLKQLCPKPDPLDEL